MPEALRNVRKEGVAKAKNALNATTTPTGNHTPERSD
jgi:hypothetical protein